MTKTDMIKKYWRSEDTIKVNCKRIGLNYSTGQSIAHRLKIKSKKDFNPRRLGVNYNNKIEY